MVMMPVSKRAIERERCARVDRARENREQPGPPAMRDAGKPTRHSDIGAEGRKPRICMKKSVRKAPMRREENRAAKSANPQRSAPASPRMIPISATRRTRRARSPAPSFAPGLQAEHGHHFLQILPHFALRGRIAKQVGGMIGGDQFRAAEIDPLAAEARDALRGLQKRLRGAGPEATDHFRANRVELAKQIGRAGGDFVVLGQAIFRRPAFHDVADVDVLAAQTHRLDHLREQFSGAADERFALNIFVVPRAFTDEHELGLRIPDAEDDVRARFVQLAARAIADVVANASSVSLDAFGGVKERRTGRDGDNR